MWKAILEEVAWTPAFLLELLVELHATVDVPNTPCSSLYALLEACIGRVEDMVCGSSLCTSFHGACCVASHVQVLITSFLVCMLHAWRLGMCITASHANRQASMDLCQSLIRRITSGLLDSIRATPIPDIHGPARMTGRLQCLARWAQQGGVAGIAAQAGGSMKLLDVLLYQLLFPEVCLYRLRNAHVDHACV